MRCDELGVPILGWSHLWGCCAFAVIVENSNFMPIWSWKRKSQLRNTRWACSIAHVCGPTAHTAQKAEQKLFLIVRNGMPNRYLLYAIWSTIRIRRRVKCYLLLAISIRTLFVAVNKPTNEPSLRHSIQQVGDAITYTARARPYFFHASNISFQRQICKIYARSEETRKKDRNRQFEHAVCGLNAIKNGKELKKSHVCDD